LNKVPASLNKSLKRNLSLALFSCELSRHTGWGRYTLEVCSALYRLGIRFQLHLPKNHELVKKVAFSECITYDLPPFFLSIKGKIFRGFSLWYASRRIHVQEKIVHSLVEFPYGPLARFCSKRSGLPYGITLHGTYAVKPLERVPDKLLFRSALARARFLISVSRYTAEKVQNAFKTELPVTVINNGVNLSSFCSNPESLLSGPDPAFDKKEKIILSVGALKPRKGLPTLLRAFKKVLQVDQNCRLVIIGAGKLSSYKEFAHKLGVLEKVTFMGKVSDSVLKKAYQRCDIFVLLPEEDFKGQFEGFGLVYLEANAYGKPVVGTKSGGVPDAIKDGVTGILVPPNNHQKAYEAMVRLLRDPALRKRMGEKAKKWALGHEWTLVIDQYVRVYLNALKGI